VTAFVIAISGFCGSGKSTYAQWMLEQCGGRGCHCAVVSVDSFMMTPTIDWDGHYKDDLDLERLVDQVLVAARSGSFSYDVYDWYQRQIGGQVVHDDLDVVIIEGVRLFQPDLMQYFDLSIWIDTDLQVGRQRGIDRDQNVYNNLLMELWDGVWTPRDMQHFEAHRPDLLADFVVANP